MPKLRCFSTSRVESRQTPGLCWLAGHCGSRTESGLTVCLRCNALKVRSLGTLAQWGEREERERERERRAVDRSTHVRYHSEPPAFAAKAQILESAPPETIRSPRMSMHQTLLVCSSRVAAHSAVLQRLATNTVKGCRKTYRLSLTASNASAPDVPEFKQAVHAAAH